MKDLRFWVVCALLVTAGLLLLRRGRYETIVRAEPLSGVPNEIAGFSGVNQSIDQATLDVLGSGDFLTRLYEAGPAKEPVGLFIGYFPTQRTGSTIHSPKNCLPGAGWSFQSSEYVHLSDRAGTSHEVGEYIIGKGESRQLVIYWYQAHGRSVANEYMAKIYLVADAMRMNRTDGALVRVTTPIGSSEEMAEARARAEGFAAELFPSLPRFIPD